MYVLYLLSKISEMCGRCLRMRIFIIKVEFFIKCSIAKHQLNVFWCFWCKIWHYECKICIKAEFSLINLLKGLALTAYMLTPTSTIKLWKNILRGLICKSRTRLWCNDSRWNIAHHASDSEMKINYLMEQIVLWLLEVA